MCAEELDGMPVLARRLRQGRSTLRTAIAPKQPFLPDEPDQRNGKAHCARSDEPIRTLVTMRVNGSQKSQREWNAEHHEVLQVSSPERRVFFAHRHRLTIELRHGAPERVSMEQERDRAVA